MAIKANQLNLGKPARANCSPAFEKFSSEDIPVSRAVKIDTTKDKARNVLLWADAITVPVEGIAIMGHLAPVDSKIFGNDTVPTPYYKPGSTIPVLRRDMDTVSVNYLVQDQVIASGDTAYIEAVTGRFSNVATNNLRIGRFLTDGIGGKDVVDIELHLGVK